MKERRRRTKFVALNAFETIKGIRNENFDPAVEFCERHDIPMEDPEYYKERFFWIGWRENSPEQRQMDLIEKITDFMRFRIDGPVTPDRPQTPQKGTGGS